MCDLEDRLKKLAIAAQTHPPDSLPRRKAVDRLLREIQQSGRLTRPPVPPQFQASYDEIYGIAIQQLFGYIYRKLDTYDPHRGEVLQWVNFLLQRRFPDAIRELSGKNWSKTVPFTLDDLETMNPIPKEEDTVKIEAKDIVECLQEDPEGLFVSTYTCQNPTANFQFIALKIVEGYTWQEIAEELNLKVSTISSFYQRNLTRFSPKIHDYLA
ncbi:hypothetical protein PN462_20050 [Spirulina sp. CS-785/01]|uniref:hypothetical protein n=1 Tax=Spirulina sp. CS-785/01 TaxID=3021716 RepID=UPI00232DF49C|nr:hypothetical protein [Spirulina sp. CS-785/01]MDB9315418.1 hypothetical protein [Spirulina sp. CS-785/01]